MPTHSQAPFPLQETDTNPTGSSANTSRSWQIETESELPLVTAGEAHATAQLVAPPPVGQWIWAS